jgi:hypothetical protein
MGLPAESDEGFDGSDSPAGHHSQILALAAPSEDSDGSDGLAGHDKQILALAASSEDSDGSDGLAGHDKQILALATSSEDSDGDILAGHNCQMLALAAWGLENDSEHHSPGHYSLRGSPGSDSTEDYHDAIIDLAQAASSAIEEESVSDNSSATGSSFHLDDTPYNKQSSPAEVDMDFQEDPSQLSVLDRQEMSSMPL